MLLNLELWFRTFIDGDGVQTLAAPTSNDASAVPSWRARARHLPWPGRRRLETMRILWLKSDLLLPLDKGGKLRTWHLMRQLAKHHAITFLSYADPEQPADDIEGMREVASEVDHGTSARPGEGHARLLPGCRTAPGRFPPVRRREIRVGPYRHALLEAMGRTAFDLIVCDFLPPAVNMPKRLPCPVVLFTHNVEAEIWRRHAETSGSVLKRQLYRGSTGACCGSRNRHTAVRRCPCSLGCRSRDVRAPVSGCRDTPHSRSADRR